MLLSFVVGLELCNGAGERALLWELLNVLFKRIARGVAMLDSLFFLGGKGFVFTGLLLTVHILVMAVRGWLLVLGEFFGESVSKKGLYMLFC